MPKKSANYDQNEETYHSRLLFRFIFAIIRVVDALDRQISAALQVNGRASWQQIARLVGSSESTIARRAQKLIESGNIQVVAIADPVLCGFGYWVLLQVKCEVGEVSRVAHTLSDRSDVRYLAVVAGPFDLVIEMIVPSQSYLAGVLLDELPQVGGIKETATRTVLRNFKMSYDWSRDLLPDSAGELERYGRDSDISGVRCVLDEVDLRLYALLLEDGRRSYSELASIAQITESLARRRVETLLERGCIKFATLLDPTLLGYEVQCVCFIRVDLSQLEQAAEILAARHEVRYLSATIDYSDLICEVILASQDDLYEFCTETLGQLPGVREVNINLKLHTLKQAYVQLMSRENSTVPLTVNGSSGVGGS